MPPNFREAAKRMKAAVAEKQYEKRDHAWEEFLGGIGGRERHDRITIAAMKGAFEAGWRARKEAELLK